MGVFNLDTVTIGRLANVLCVIFAHSPYENRPIDKSLTGYQRFSARDYPSSADGTSR